MGKTPESAALEAVSGRADDSRTSPFALAGGDSPVDGAAGSAADAEALLRSLDVVDVAPVAESERLRLESGFRRAWRDRIRDFRERNAQLEALARRVEVAPERLALAVTADGFVATCDRTRIGCWPSNAAFLADLAAAWELEREGDAGWRALEERDRGTALTALRLFLERCPNCDGAVVEADPAAVRIGASDRSLAGGSAGSGSESASEPDPRASLALECKRCGVMLVREPYE